MQSSIPIDWKTIHTVFLDLDGTLLDLHFDNHFWLQHMPKRYAEKYGVTYEKASEVLLDRSNATKGSLNWYCLDYWEKSVNMDIVNLKHEVSDKISVRSNVVGFLKHLKLLGKNIVLLTNAHRNSLKVKFDYVEINQYFDEIITSHDIGLAKEELGFWEALSESKTFNKENSLFIDDNLDVLDNAKIYGISQLLSISQPDSQKPPNTTGDYIGIDDYNQLIN